jgi:hypothetical protein
LHPLTYYLPPPPALSFLEYTSSLVLCGAIYLYQTETDPAKKYLTVDSREAVVVFTGVVMVSGIVMAIVNWASGGNGYALLGATDYVGASIAGVVFMVICKPRLASLHPLSLTHMIYSTCRLVDYCGVETKRACNDVASVYDLQHCVLDCRADSLDGQGRRAAARLGRPHTSRLHCVCRRLASQSST